MSALPSKEAVQLAYLIGDLPGVYAPQCLKILSKQGEKLPLDMNRAQLYFHARCEDMLRRKGFIRIIVLKGRQQGLSTYSTARFYWKGSTEFGKRAFIMTHVDAATTNLFNMIKRFHDNVPAVVKPHTKADNAKELYFDKLDTRYSVATAGSREAGRSANAQYFLGSEVAFWPNGESNMRGLGQVIALEQGTEIILESTANGIGNYFHKAVLSAIAGKGDYEFVFIPWFWEDGYRRKVPKDFAFEPEELEYQEAYGCDDEQLYWRHIKIADDFAGDVTSFDQEYPATPEIAFMAGTSRALINPRLVNKAIRRSEITAKKSEPIVIGVDPGEYGDDDTGIVIRWGRRVVHIEAISKAGNEAVAGRVAMLIDQWKPDAVNIDVTGVGTGVEAFLSAAGYTGIHRVHFGEAAIEPTKYINRAAECWGRLLDWLRDPTLPVSLPPHLLLQSELSSREYHYNASRRLVLESKEQMAKRGVASPNLADALALTFATNVSPRRRAEGETVAEKLARLRARQGVHTGGSPGMGS